MLMQMDYMEILRDKTALVTSAKLLRKKLVKQTKYQEDSLLAKNIVEGQIIGNCKEDALYISPMCIEGAFGWEKAYAWIEALDDDSITQLVSQECLFEAARLIQSCGSLSLATLHARVLPRETASTKKVLDEVIM